MSRAPVRPAPSRTASANAGLSGRTPPSPWIASITMAAVDDETASSSAGGLSGETHVTSGEQRRERRAVVLVPRHRQRAHRPAVERVLERDEPGAVRLTGRVPVAARELEAGFDRLGAAVAEERARQARERGKARGHLALQRVDSTGSTCAQRRRLVGEGAASAGFAWPSDATPTPETRSRYRVPVASQR